MARHLSCLFLILCLGVLATGCQKDPPASPASPATDEPEAAGDSSTAAAPPPTVASEPPADGWGHLKGRFVYDAAAPKQKELRITSDVEFCGRHHPLDESLIVHAENLGLANVVVSMYLGREDAAPSVHASYEGSAQEKIALDNKKCAFVPHIVLLRTSQTLNVINSDSIAHNTKIDTLINPPINPTLPAGESLEHQFTQVERAPARVSCSIHPWMSAFVIVREDPYVAATNRNGQFQILNLPAGAWTFQAWHEKTRYVTDVKLGEKETKWTRGRFTVNIQSGETTDLGEVRLAPQMFGGS